MSDRTKGGLQKYTIQESQNIGLGQGGSIYLHTDNTDTITGSFVAIQCIEDTVFNALTPSDTTYGYGVGSYNGNTMASETIPAGTVIYGRWTTIDLTSGLVIAYIG